MGIEQLIGKTITAIKGMEQGNDEIIFQCRADRYKMFHSQDCCESVFVEDVCGDVQDLIGAEILSASEETNSDNPPSECDESWTWTFYKIQSTKGAVTIRWLGESNGYYGEEVSFVREPNTV